MSYALITGASSGIGKELALLLNTKGISLILTGRDETRLQEIATKVDAKKIIVADLLYEDGREKVCQAIREACPDILINAAGFGIYGDALSTSVEEQVAILEVNARAALEFTLVAAKTLIDAKKGGVILNVSSLAGEHPSPGMSVYAASKSFVTMVSRALNDELSEKGVYVLSSCPGMVDTDFANRAAKQKVELRGGPVMTPQFAAREIWKQIEKKKEIHLFNWQYRWSSRLAKYFAPTSLVKKMIKRRIYKRI